MDELKKRCPACGESKSRSEFYLDKSRKDGHCPRCKACRAAQSKAYRESDPEKHAKRCREWREKNREYHRAYMRMYMYKRRTKPAKEA